MSEKYRVAIIGSGPAGFYAADHLFRSRDFTFCVDMFDKLPTPFGLVRSGVAPDHQKIKTVTRIFDKIASNENFRFFGNVEFGKDIYLEDLKKLYHIIIFATGAETDRKMKIPGEDLPGSHTATEFVAWYNGHPAYTHREFNLDVNNVAIIGVGNVAVDVARILCRTVDELSNTDIADYALGKLSKSKIKEIYMIGRRGPAQAAFTNPELKELANLSDARLITLKEETDLDKYTQQYINTNDDVSIKKKIEILKEHNNGSDNTSKSKKLYIRFLLSPIELIGDSKNGVSKLRLCRNELYLSDDGSIRSKATDKTEELDAGLVFRSIGYYGVPLKDVPFDARWGTIPNKNGRVTDNHNNIQIGLYATGWIKRGATGVIGTNKTDSGESVNCILEDIPQGKFIHTENTSNDSILDLLKNRENEIISYEDWLKIDRFETEAGGNKGKPRKKITNINEFIKIGKS